MERRKVQVTGGSTFIISLPKKWIDANDIRQGDALDVHVEPTGGVTIYPAGQRPVPSRAVTIQVDPKEPLAHTERQIIAAYLAGYETVVVEAQGRFPPENKQSVRRLAQTLIGIEIVEESQHRIVLQDLLDPVDFDLTKATERMHQIARTMVADALSALRTGDDDLASDVPQRDPEVDRLDWMITKQFHLVSASGRLASTLKIGPSDALHTLLVSAALERIADHAARLAEIVGSPGSKQMSVASREALADYGGVVLGLHDAAFQAFRRNDMRGANETLSRCREVSVEASSLLSRAKGQPAPAQVALALLVKSIERVRSYTMDIAEAAIDQYMIQLGRQTSR